MGEPGTSSLAGLGATCELDHEVVELAKTVLTEASSVVSTPVLALAAGVATIPMVDVSVGTAGDSTGATPGLDRERLAMADEFDASC